MLRAVTFDFWQTLYQGTFAHNERLRLLDEALSRHSQTRSQADLEAAYRHAHSLWEQVWREEHRPLATTFWLRDMLTFLDANLPEDTLANLGRSIEEVFLHGNSRPHPVVGVIETLPRLARRYRLGLISDTGLTPGRVLRTLLRRDGLLPYFDALTFSDETGATKPRSEQFTRTLALLQVRPTEAAHVGDLPETDLAGARAVGMKTVLFLGESQRRDGQPLADGTFEKYSELEKLLEQLG